MARWRESRRWYWQATLHFSFHMSDQIIRGCLAWMQHCQVICYGKRATKLPDKSTLIHSLKDDCLTYMCLLEDLVGDSVWPGEIWATGSLHSALPARGGISVQLELLSLKNEQLGDIGHWSWNSYHRLFVANALPFMLPPKSVTPLELIMWHEVDLVPCLA